MPTESKTQYTGLNYTWLVRQYCVLMSQFFLQVVCYYICMNIALYGSGEFTESVTEIDRFLIKRYGLTSVAIIPTAAGKERDFHKWIDLGVSHYEGMGISVISVPIIDNQDANNDQLVQLLDKSDWIFFSGGDPKYLLDTIKSSKLWDMVTQRANAGALITGSSAGAMVMGKFILTNPLKALMTPTPASWEAAFGLVQFTVIPHFDKIKRVKKMITRIIGKSPDGVQKSWVGIEENTALIIDDKDRIVKGLGTVEFGA